MAHSTHVYINAHGEYLVMSQSQGHTGLRTTYRYVNDIDKASVFHAGKKPKDWPEHLIAIPAKEFRRVKLITD